MAAAAGHLLFMTTMTLHRLLLTLALVPASGACGVKSVGDLDDTGGGSGDGSSGSAGSSDGSASATGNTSVATTDEPGTDSGSASDSSAGDDGSCPPFDGSICDPQEQFGPEAAVWTFDGGAFAADVLDVQCNVAEFVDDDVTMTITLECDEEELSQHTVVAPHNAVTPFNLGVGTIVRLTYRADMPFWRNEWFNLRGQDGRFILGGVQSSALLPADAPDFFAPIGVTLLDDVCDIEPDCDEFCGPIRRDAIGVAVGDGELVSIYDGNTGVVGSPTTYTFVVGEAYSRVGDSGCEDVPEAWFGIIAYDSSEG